MKEEKDISKELKQLPSEGNLNLNFTLPKEIKTIHLMALTKDGDRVPLYSIVPQESVDFFESNGLRFFSLRTK